MISKIAFLPTLAFTVFMEKFGGRPWYSRVDKTVILGALPFRSVIPEVSP